MRWLLVFVPVAALAQTGVVHGQTDVVELFVDRGDTFIRAGTQQGLAVGTVVSVVGPTIGNTSERRTVGTATVLEIWPSLSRVHLDAPAQAETGERFAALPPGKGGKSAVHPLTTTTTVSTPTNITPPPPPPVEERTLKGRAEIIGVGPARRITLYNRSGINWHNCELRLPDNKRYVLYELTAGDSEGIVLPKFSQDGAAYDRPYDKLTVTCAEGSSIFEL